MSLPKAYSLAGNSITSYTQRIQLSVGCLLMVGGLSVSLSTYAGDEHRSSKRSSDKSTEKTEIIKSHPINISADQLISQTKGGHSEYSGKVVLQRHKLETTGDSLKITHPNDRLQTATIQGNPAKFKDFMPKKQQWVTGEAKRIVFEQDKDTITLYDQASITTDAGNQIKADQIVLYNKTETFEALGNKKQGSRVQMVIQAE